MIKYHKITNRSIEENSYYWAVVVGEIAYYKHWQAIVAHEWIKTTFGVDSTTSLSTTKFEDLMETVRQHVQKYWNLYISLPNE